MDAPRTSSSGSSASSGSADEPAPRPPMFSRTVTYGSLTNKPVDWKPEKMAQHRCHARLADVVHTVARLSLLSTPGRVRLWVACLMAEPGKEPGDAYLVDPATHTLRPRER